MSAEGTEEIDIRLRQNVDTEGAKAAAGGKAIAAGFDAAAAAGERFAKVKMPAIVNEGSRLRAIAKDADAAAVSLSKLAAARTSREDSAMGAGLAALKASSAAADGIRSHEEAAELASANKKAAIDEAAYQKAMAREARNDKAKAKLADAAYEKAVAASNKTPASLQAKAPPPVISGFQKLLQGVEGVFGQKAAGGLAKGAMKLAEVDESMGGKLIPALAAGAGAYGAAAVAVVGAATAAAAIIYKTLSAVASSSIEASDRKTKALAGLGEGGEETYKLAVATSVKLGGDLDQTIRDAKGLVATGFAKDKIPIVLEAVADIKIAKSEEAGNALQKGLEKIMAKGKFGSEGVDALAEAGIRAELVYEALAESTGDSMAVVAAKVKAGQYSVAAGIDAILAAAKATGGGAATKAAATVSDKLNGLKILSSTLFDGVDTGPLKGALDNAQQAIGGADGGKMKSALTGLGTQLFETLFGPFKGPDGAKRMEIVVKRVTELATSATEVLKDAAPYVKSFVDVMLAFTGADMSGSSNSAAQMITGIADVARMAVHPLDTVWALVTKIANAGASVAGALGISNGAPVFDAKGAAVTAASSNDNSAAVASATTAGGDIAGGLAAGVTAGGPEIAAAVTSAANDAVTAAKVALGIASPSKVFAGVGKWGALGMAKGMNDNAGVVADAGASMAGASVGGASGAMGSASSSSSSSGGGDNITLQINITLPPGSAAETHAAAETGARAGYAEFLQNYRRLKRDSAEQKAG